MGAGGGGNATKVALNGVTSTVNVKHLSPQHSASTAGNCRKFNCMYFYSIQIPHAEID